MVWVGVRLIGVSVGRSGRGTRYVSDAGQASAWHPWQYTLVQTSFYFSNIRCSRLDDINCIERPSTPVALYFEVGHIASYLAKGREDAPWTPEVNHNLGRQIVSDWFLLYC